MGSGPAEVFICSPGLPLNQFGGSDECQAFVTGLSTVQPQRRQGRSTGQEESIM